MWIISPETLPKRRKEISCQEQFTPSAMSCSPARVQKFSSIHAAKFSINKKNLFISKKLTNRLYLGGFI